MTATGRHRPIIEGGSRPLAVARLCFTTQTQTPVYRPKKDVPNAGSAREVRFGTPAQTKHA